MFSLYSISDWLRTKTCFERQKTGSCSCRGKNQFANPCQVTTDLADACEQAERLDDVLKRVKIHRCNDPHCTHKGCARTDEMESTLRREMNIPVAA